MPQAYGCRLRVAGLGLQAWGCRHEDVTPGCRLQPDANQVGDDGRSRYISPISPLYLPYISPVSQVGDDGRSCYVSAISPRYLHYISPISPRYLHYISPISQVGEDGRSRWAVEPWRSRLGGGAHHTQARWRLVSAGGAPTPYPYPSSLPLTPTPNPYPNPNPNPYPYPPRVGLGRARAGRPRGCPRGGRGGERWHNHGAAV